jgi:predicted secreted hydrolase
MSMRRLILLVLAAGVVLAAALWWVLRPVSAPSPAQLDVAAALGGVADAGFERADGSHRFRFPADHGPHPAFRNEWWYFTGNLSAADGRRYGYELSLFRIALAPQAPRRASAWAGNQVYMGHFAVTDANGRRFRFFERFARGVLGLAGARSTPFAVWIEDWRVQADATDPDRWQLTAKAGEVEVALRLTPVKPIVLQGERGLSRKSAAPGNASYYYSIPRLDTEGTLTLAGEAVAVRGSSWLDREWSTSALGPDQAGWDWFALQLDDGRELMVYQLRRRDGSVDPYSAGMLIDRHGVSTPLRVQDVRVDVVERWPSPRGGVYPARWRLTVPALDLALDIKPLLSEQELMVSVRYWEGAVDVSGGERGRALRGVGYAELTGYAPAGGGVGRRQP